MYKSAVNDNAEDFPKVAGDAYPTEVIMVKFVSTFVDWGDQSLVPNIVEDARAQENVEEFKNNHLNLWSVYVIISFSVPSTPQAFLGWRVCILSCSSFNVFGESGEFW